MTKEVTLSTSEKRRGPPLRQSHIHRTTQPPLSPHSPTLKVLRHSHTRRPTPPVLRRPPSHHMHPPSRSPARKLRSPARRKRCAASVTWLSSRKTSSLRQRLLRNSQSGFPDFPYLIWRCRNPRRAARNPQFPRRTAARPPPQRPCVTKCPQKALRFPQPQSPVGVATGVGGYGVTYGEGVATTHGVGVANGRSPTLEIALPTSEAIVDFAPEFT